MEEGISQASFEHTPLLGIPYKMLDNVFPRPLGLDHDAQQHFKDGATSEKGELSSTQTCTLLKLEAALLCALWPADRALQGMSVCKPLRAVLQEGPGTILLHQNSTPGELSPCPSLADISLFRNWSIDLRLRRNNTQMRKSDQSNTAAHILSRFHQAGMSSRLISLQLDRKGSLDVVYFTQELASALASAHSLRHLHLGGLYLCEEAAVLLAAALLPCASLLVLDLGGTRIDDGGAVAVGSALPSCFQLRECNLSANRFSSAGARSLMAGLGQCVHLHGINLSSNLHLCHSWQELGAVSGRALEVVNFAGCRVGPFLIGQLAGVLSECENLRELNLTNTEAGDEGMEALVPVLQRCTCLHRLKVGHNNFSPDAARWIARGLGSLRHGENTHGNEPDDCRRSSPPNTSLTELNLYGNFLSEHGCQRVGAALASCSVVRLVLGCNDLQVAGAQALAPLLPQCTSLEHLDVYGNRMGDGGFAALANVLPLCTNLRSLSAGGNSITCAFELESSTLEVLSLGNNELGPSAEKAFGSFALMPALTALHLNRNQLTDDVVEMLLELDPQIQVLDLSDNELSDDALTEIAKAMLCTCWDRGAAAAELERAKGRWAGTAPRRDGACAHLPCGWGQTLKHLSLANNPLRFDVWNYQGRHDLAAAMSEAVALQTLCMRGCDMLMKDRELISEVSGFEDVDGLWQRQKR